MAREGPLLNVQAMHHPLNLDLTFKIDQLLIAINYWTVLCS